jgi:pantoate--beta-alanine ligase
MYPKGFSTAVTVAGVSAGTEGAIRPDHFRGVATVVLKLFNIVQPDVAIFGAKDFQQQAVLRRMTRDLDLPIEIITAPTIREDDGLAKSSRNVYLSSKERKSALVLSESLRAAEERLKAGEMDLGAVTASMLETMKGAPGVVPDYAIIADPESLQPLTAPQRRMVILVAARVGLTRLIDNREVTIGA